MAKNAAQKRKLPVLAELLLRETDERHPLSMAELIERLAAAGISAERKSLYDDLEQLRLLGYDVEAVSGGRGGYYIASRSFELPELKLLVDAVQSSRFLTHRKSEELIAKVEQLASRHQARQLLRQVHVAGRIKNMNESIYYNVDALQTAMQENRTVRFLYYEWVATGRSVQRRPRRSGQQYEVSPWVLSWSGDNYYLIAYDGAHGIRHFRVDKMGGIETTEAAREGAEELAQFDMGEYDKQVFGMFGGERRDVRMHFDASLTDVIVDRFGRDVLLQADETGVTVTTSVVPSLQFFGWLFGLGTRVRLLSPPDLAEQMRALLEQVAGLYPAD